MKRILGIDLGTNSIGWAVIIADEDENGHIQLIRIEGCGSRIIPMDASVLGDFDRGNSISQTAERTRLRGIRRLIERNLLRRERLHRILNLMGFLPRHYSEAVDRYGKFIQDQEVKIAWKINQAGEYEFVFMDSFNEMLEDFKLANPNIVTDNKKIPYDWTVYYLRKKALSKEISKEELAWILLNFNQKRGYNQLRDEEEKKNNLEYRVY